MVPCCLAQLNFKHCWYRALFVWGWLECIGCTQENTVTKFKVEGSKTFLQGLRKLHQCLGITDHWENSMEIATGLIKLKAGSEDKVEEWRKTMADRPEEVRATLKHEGVEIESWFKIEIEGQLYLLWYMRAESIKKAFEVSRTFKHPIDKYHYELMASITAPNGNILGEPILDLHNR